LSTLGELQNAVAAYQKVVELAPSHMSARVSLSALQQQLGRHQEALEVLKYTGGSLILLHRFSFKDGFLLIEPPNSPLR